MTGKFYVQIDFVVAVLSWDDACQNTHTHTHTHTHTNIYIYIYIYIYEKKNIFPCSRLTSIKIKVIEKNAKMIYA